MVETNDDFLLELTSSFYLVFMSCRPSCGTSCPILKTVEVRDITPDLRYFYSSKDTKEAPSSLGHFHITF